MTYVTRRGAWLASVFCQFAGVALVLAGGGGNAIAEVDDYPDFDCAQTLNPCTTCTDTMWVWQCQLTLNGWTWGTCTEPLGLGCQETQSTCGDKTDCATPPNPLAGSQCGGTFRQCNNL
jgi:hypothetical protein